MQNKSANSFSIFGMNRKGGTAYNWVYGLVTLFGLGILYVVFNQVFLVHLVPTINAQVGNSSIDAATQATIFAANAKYMTFWSYLPFILFAVVVIFMFVSAVSKEREDTIM